MSRLTDIKHPWNYYNSEPSAPKEPFFRRLKNGLAAPFRWMKRFLGFLVPKSYVSWIIILLFLILAWQVVSSFNFPAVDKNKIQAVVLADNQVYFGRLKDLNSDYAALENAFRLRQSQAGQINLARLGDELPGPENIMYIPKDKILFWENLRQDSPVVKAIERLDSRE